jgi:hypothetical protein
MADIENSKMRPSQKLLTQVSTVIKQKLKVDLKLFGENPNNTKSKRTVRGVILGIFELETGSERIETSTINLFLSKIFL